MTDEQRITVTVRFFAGPREALGVDKIVMALPAGATVADMIAQLEKQYPALESYTRFLHIAVNRAYVGMQTALRDGDEAACLPPVGGG